MGVGMNAGLRAKSLADKLNRAVAEGQISLEQGCAIFDKLNSLPIGRFGATWEWNRSWFPRLITFEFEDYLSNSGPAITSRVNAEINIILAELASELPIIRPGTPEWRAAVQDLRSPGKSKNYRVKTKEEAEQLLEEGRGPLPKKETYTKEKYNHGQECHPDESRTANAPDNDLPHIKWKDWRAGKKGGANGHIFYDE